MDIQSILTEIERDERAFAQKHGGSRASLERLSVVNHVFTDKGEPRVQIGLASNPDELIVLKNHKGDLREHLGKHVVVIRDDVGFAVRLFGLVGKTN